jgi:DNA-binding PadR family transcriptional regulator
VTAETVRERLSRPLKQSTVRTVLRRLEEKGYITHTVDGRTDVYDAAEPRGRRRLARTDLDAGAQSANAHDGLERRADRLDGDAGADAVDAGDDPFRGGVAAAGEDRLGRSSLDRP